MTVLITGGAGFIGSNFVKLHIKRHPDVKVVVLDVLTYCGNMDNFPPEILENDDFEFIHGDIRDRELVEKIMARVDRVIHFAAETHIDRSIDNSDPFISTDVKGTQVLLEAARKHPVERFIHISTSEVYGTAEQIPMTEEHPLKPKSPYAAAKCGADRLAYAYFVTHDVPTCIIRPFNNYGPNQFPEKLIPLFITNAMEDKDLPVYGTGKNTRDWLYVEDCCDALDRVLNADVESVKGEVINLGTGKDYDVLTITGLILDGLGKPRSLTRHVGDRPGHVERLISSTDKARAVLRWEARTGLEEGLRTTVDWFKANKDWWEKIKKGRREYQDFYKEWYSRL
ncbi:MAG: dTDP-glucose 4,6-dehydratase [bacterium]